MEVLAYNNILREYQSFNDQTNDEFMKKLHIIGQEQYRHKKKYLNVNINTTMINFDLNKNNIFLNINKLCDSNYESIVSKLKNDIFNNNKQVPKFIVSKISNSKNDHEIIIRMLLDVQDIWILTWKDGNISILDYLLIDIQKIFEKHCLKNQAQYQNIIHFMCCLSKYNIISPTIIKQSAHYIIKKHRDIDHGIYMLNYCNFDDNILMFKKLYNDKTLPTKTLFKLEEYMCTDKEKIQKVVDTNQSNHVNDVKCSIEEYLNHDDLNELFLTIKTFNVNNKDIIYGILISYISGIIDKKCVIDIIAYSDIVEWQEYYNNLIKDADLLFDYPNAQSLLAHIV